MKKPYSYVAIAPSCERPIEIDLQMRLLLALLANAAGCPFVYTPIQSTLCLTKSELASDAFNQRWADFFRRVADECVVLEQADDETLLLGDDFSPVTFNWFAFGGEHVLNEELPVSWELKMALYKVRGFFSQLDEPIKKSFVREFTRRTHHAYRQTFVDDAQASGGATSADDTLQAVFVLHEDGGLRSPFLLDRLPALVDFAQARAQALGCDLQLRLFTSFVWDQALPAAWERTRARALEVACAQPSVQRHVAPSWETLLKHFVSADLTWVAGTWYGRDILRPLLLLLSKPEQVALEMVPTSRIFRLNQCFLAWNQEQVIYEKKKLSAALSLAKQRTNSSPGQFKNWLSARLPRRRRPHPIKVASGVVDGAGSCFAKVWLLQIVADYHELQYVHTPRMAVDHNYDADPEWVNQWEAFFMPGEGYPEQRAVFGERTPEVYYSYHLPAAEQLNALELSPDTLVVSNMVSLGTWPVPDEYLVQHLTKTRVAFQARHQHWEDGFHAHAVNVAIHIRALDDYLPPLKKVYETQSQGRGRPMDLPACAARVKRFHDSLQSLGMPFHLHIYSDARRAELASLLDFCDVHLHVAEERDDWRLDCLEMSRADIFLPGHSRISYVAAMLAKPEQLQLITSSTEPDLMRLLLLRGNSFYREHDCLLSDVKLLERFVRPHF